MNSDCNSMAAKFKWLLTETRICLTFNFTVCNVIQDRTLKGFEGFFLLPIKMILLPIGPYTILPCSFKIFKPDSLQIDCGTFVILNFEHVTDEDEQDGWIGGTMTGGLKLWNDRSSWKGNHVIFITFKTKFFFQINRLLTVSPPKKYCSFLYKQPALGT